MNIQGNFWAVVRVWRGFPDGVELFTNEGAAKRREKQIRRKLPIEDEVAILEVRTPKTS